MSSALLTRTAAPALTDKQVYRLLFAATFVVFLVAVAIRRLARALRAESAPSRKSIFAEARDTGSSTLLIAFAG